MYTTVPLRYINGKDEKMGVIDPWEWITLRQEGHYQFGDDSFRIEGLYEGKKIVYTSMEGDRKNQTDADRVKLEVRIGEQTLSEGYFNPRTNDPQWQSFIYKGAHLRFYLCTSPNTSAICSGAHPF